jgi:hypothetical protein
MYVNGVRGERRRSCSPSLNSGRGEQRGFRIAPLAVRTVFARERGVRVATSTNFSQISS